MERQIHITNGTKPKTSNRNFRIERLFAKKSSFADKEVKLTRQGKVASGLEDRKIVEYQNHWKWNIATKECWFSDSWCKNLGFEPSELAGHEDTWKSLVHKDCMPNVWGKLQHIISGGKERYECIYRLRNKADKYIWHLDTGKVLERDADGMATMMEGYDVPIAC